MRAAEVAAVARLDLGDVLRSRWLLLCLLLYGCLGSVFVLVGLRESSVLGFTGIGRVLFSLCHALVLFLPLFALLATGLAARFWPGPPRSFSDGTSRTAPRRRPIPHSPRSSRNGESCRAWPRGWPSPSATSTGASPPGWRWVWWQPAR